MLAVIGLFLRLSPAVDGAIFGHERIRCRSQLRSLQQERARPARHRATTDDPCSAFFCPVKPRRLTCQPLSSDMPMKCILQLRSTTPPLNGASRWLAPTAEDVQSAYSNEMCRQRALAESTADACAIRLCYLARVRHASTNWG
jgi:hypothetical protein